MSDVRCDCCGGGQFRRVGKKRGWTIHECCSCHVMFVDPQPSDDVLKTIYATEAGYFAGDAGAVTKIGNATGADSVISAIQPFLGLGRRFLDVGCAKGNMLKGFSENGWNVAGIEINKGAANIAKSCGFVVYECELSSAPFPPASFDVIRFGQVLEHLPSPKAALLLARNLLAENGLVYLTVPNSDSAFSRMTRDLSRFFGMDWPHSEAPYHLWEFNNGTLARLLNDTGFDVVLQTTYGQRSFGYTVGSSGYFDDFKVVSKNSNSYWLKGSAFVRAVIPLILVTCAYFPFYLIGRIVDRKNGVGHKLLCVARRRD